MTPIDPSTDGEPPPGASAGPPTLPVAALGALGVVFGDLATSPLYTLQTVVQAVGGHFTPERALGILSLIVWTLIITVSVKYCLFVMRADNNGEGGILALMSLVGADRLGGRALVLTVMGLVGAALIYGDGVITPAISVLSALEGVNVFTDALKPYIMPIAVGILAALFAAQRFGTARIGRTFGPIMLTWCVVIAVLGLAGIVRNPQVLWAIDPRHAVSFLAHGGAGGFLALGGVFLCITGGEALYADMGHFGSGPIRLSWFAVVLPALLLNYAGQTGLLIEKGEIHGNPFFQLAPPWAIYPLVALSTVATIIASQSIITGSFSMTRQAMQLGWLPAVSIRQTSDRIYGQIYVPVVNGLMMLATIGITIAFGSSVRLAGAYGTAVATTMLLTTGLLFTAMRKVWGWSIGVSLAAGGAFLIVDLGFFSANLLKVFDGGWVPLMLGAMIFLIMAIWRWGLDAIQTSVVRLSESPERFVGNLKTGAIPRVPGTAIFMTRLDEMIPALLVDHVDHMGALHQAVIALTVRFDETPRVAERDRTVVTTITNGVWRVIVRYGFIEIPNLAATLRSLKGLDPSIDIENALYFAKHDLVVPAPGASPLVRVAFPIFAFLYRNTVRVVERFNLPPDRVIEVGREIAI